MQVERTLTAVSRHPATQRSTKTWIKSCSHHLIFFFFFELYIGGGGIKPRVSAPLKHSEQIDESSHIESLCCLHLPCCETVFGNTRGFPGPLNHKFTRSSPKLHTVPKLIIKRVHSLQYTKRAATAFSTQKTRTEGLRSVLVPFAV